MTMSELIEEIPSRITPEQRDKVRREMSLLGSAEVVTEQAVGSVYFHDNDGERSYDLLFPSRQDAIDYFKGSGWDRMTIRDSEEFNIIYERQ